jgi:hypothetical protein
VIIFSPLFLFLKSFNNHLTINVWIYFVACHSVQLGHMILWQYHDVFLWFLDFIFLKYWGLFGYRIWCLLGSWTLSNRIEQNQRHYTTFPSNHIKREKLGKINFYNIVFSPVYPIHHFLQLLTFLKVDLWLEVWLKVQSACLTRVKPKYFQKKNWDLLHFFGRQSLEPIVDCSLIAGGLQWHTDPDLELFWGFEELSLPPLSCLTQKPFYHDVLIDTDL